MMAHWSWLWGTSLGSMEMSPAMLGDTDMEMVSTGRMKASGDHTADLPPGQTCLQHPYCTQLVEESFLRKAYSGHLMRSAADRKWILADALQEDKACISSNEGRGDSTSGMLTYNQVKVCTTELPIRGRGIYAQTSPRVGRDLPPSYLIAVLPQYPSLSLIN